MGCSIIRGTTPTLNFTLPFNCSELTKCNISFCQSGEIKIQKELSDCTYADKVLSVTLSETDTLQLDCTHKLEMQLRCAVGDTKMASQIITTGVGKILKEGCL